MCAIGDVQLAAGIAAVCRISQRRIRPEADVGQIQIVAGCQPRDVTFEVLGVESSSLKTPVLPELNDTASIEAPNSSSSVVPLIVKFPPLAGRDYRAAC
jgi:hypothetical protein